MIPVQDLTPEQRDRLRASYLARIHRTNDPEWQKFWETEVLFLDGRNDEALAQLCELSETENRDVAVAALMSLGEWYEQSGVVASALQAYTKAIETDRGAALGVRARTKLAGLHNKAHNPSLAAATLESAVAAIDNVPADVVQFVVVEYCQALRDLGRVDEARMLIRRAMSSFPDRAELGLLDRHLFGDSE